MKKELYRISTGTCEACDKVLTESEMRIKGVVSGIELGLCGECASYVHDLTSGLELDKQNMDVVAEYTDQEYQQALSDFMEKQDG